MKLKNILISSETSAPLAVLLEISKQFAERAINNK